MAVGPIKNIAKNRKARFEYQILDQLEVGLELLGSEVKSLRSGRSTIAESYIKFEKKEAWLVAAHIPTYPQAGPNNHEPTRPRKLLMRKGEIASWGRRSTERGYTVVPLRMYFQGPWVKLEIGLGKGQKHYDKRQKLKERTDKREASRAMRDRG
jgi:SsrA-binding protein